MRDGASCKKDILEPNDFFEAKHSYYRFFRPKRGLKKEQQKFIFHLFGVEMEEVEGEDFGTHFFSLLNLFKVSVASLPKEERRKRTMIGSSSSLLFF